MSPGPPPTSPPRKQFPAYPGIRSSFVFNPLLRKLSSEISVFSGLFLLTPVPGVTSTFHCPPHRILVFPHYLLHVECGFGLTGVACPSPAARVFTDISFPFPVSAFSPAPSVFPPGSGRASLIFRAGAAFSPSTLLALFSHTPGHPPSSCFVWTPLDRKVLRHHPYSFPSRSF